MQRHVTSTSGHVDIQKVLFDSTSDSAKQKYEQARRMIAEAAAKQGRSDPEKITVSSSSFIVNELYNYSGMQDALSRETMKGEDALVGIISGMRWVYALAGHTGSWNVSRDAEGRQIVSGNPLVDNPEITQLLDALIPY